MVYKYLLSSLKLPFHLLFLFCAEFFWFDMFSLVYFQILFLLYLFFVSCLSKKVIANSNVKELFSNFLLEVLWTLGLMFKFLIHFKLIFVSGIKIRVQFYYFICEYLVFSIPFLKENILSPLGILGSLVKYQFMYFYQYIIHILCVVLKFSILWAYVWSLDSVSLVYVSLFMPIPYHFDYYSFVIQVEIRTCNASSFLFSFSGLFG